MASVETIVSGMAGRYALALFELAREQNAVDAVSGDLHRFVSLIDSSPDLDRMVRSPVFAAEEQGRAIDAILSRAEIGGIAGNFFKLLATKRRLFALRDMVAGFDRLNDASRNLVRAQVTAAEPLAAQHLDALKAALNDATGGQNIALDVKVDPQIIGGLVVRLGSRMVDGSLRTKLNTLRLRMKEVG